jgi:hypothetical protein
MDDQQILKHSDTPSELLLQGMTGLKNMLKKLKELVALMNVSHVSRLPNERPANVRNAGLERAAKFFLK